MLMPRDAIPLHVQYATELSGQEPAPAVRAQPGRRRRPEHVPAVLRPAGGRPGRGPAPVAVPDAERERPRGPADVAGHHLRRRRQRRQHARGLAGARHRRDHAQGLAGGDRAGRLLGRRHLLVRRGNDGLVRPPAAAVHRRAGDAGRELLPALPLRGRAAAAVPAAGGRAARCPAGWPATTASARTSSTTTWRRWSPTARAGPATGSSRTRTAGRSRPSSRFVSWGRRVPPRAKGRAEQSRRPAASGTAQPSPPSTRG